MSEAQLAGINVVADVDDPASEALIGSAVRFLYDLRDRLPTFVVYDHPTDFPDAFIARLWLIRPEMPVRFVLRARTLEVLRNALEAIGLVQLSRADADQPHIVETWI